MDNDNDHKGFLLDLYLNSFNKRSFDSFTPAETSEKAETIVRQFLDLIQDYPAASLEKNGIIPDDLWNGMKQIGLFGLNIPEPYGGVGLTVSQYLKVLRVIAGIDLALAIIPMAHLSIGLKGVLLYGDEGQKRLYLPKAASGEMIFAYALTEPKIGSDAQHVSTTATLSDDGRSYILNGQKTYITNGGYAGGLVVFAQMDPAKPGFMGAFIVETATEGVQIGKDMPKMGLTISSTTAISLKDVHVPKENLLGKPGDGFKIAMSILNYGRLGLGAASIGVMNRSIDEMLKRSSKRIQFDRPIKDFELIQEKMVRARVWCAVAEAMTEFTAEQLDAEPFANMTIESSHTKLFSTTRAWETLYDAMQTAGGAGYLATQPYEKLMRDFRVTTIFEGTTEIHSIYPSLFLFRMLSKERKLKKQGTVKFFLSMLGRLFKRPSIGLHYKDKTLQKAVSYVHKNAKRIRHMLVFGAILHGRKLINKEFYLRKITHLSLYLYGTLCMLAMISGHQKKDQDVSREVRLLSYFLEDAKVAWRENSHFFESKKEKLHHRIFHDIDTVT